MNTQFWVVQAFNGVSYGALLFLVGSRPVADLRRHAHRQSLARLLFLARRLRRAVGDRGDRLLGAVDAGCRAHHRRRRLDRWSACSCGSEGHAKLVRDARDRVWHRARDPAGDRPQSCRNYFPARSAALSRSRWSSIVFAIPIFLLLHRISAVAIETDVLRQVLLTVGFAFLFQQAALDIWGGNNMDINPPSALTQSIVIGGMYLPLYRCS